ncbi:MAG: hypothetical protein KAV87_32970 [Desulfobacteraceae bacterium]|nr:hypothetical protein [Desulfobacteraceae bacterium]
MGDLKEIKLSINSHESDGEHLSQLTTLLRDELEQLDIEKITVPSHASQPEGAKSGDVFSWGLLLLTLAASGGVLTTLITALKSWVLRQNECNIKIELDGDVLEIKGVDSEEQQRIIERWLARHPMGD